MEAAANVMSGALLSANAHARRHKCLLKRRLLIIAHEIMHWPPIPPYTGSDHI